MADASDLQNQVSTFTKIKDFLKQHFVKIKFVVLNLLWFGLNMNGIILGSMHINYCPVSPVIPAWGITSSVFGFLQILQSVLTIYRYGWNPDNVSRKWRFGLLGYAVFMLALVVMGNVVVFLAHGHVSFDPLSPDYCNQALMQTYFTTIIVNDVIWGIVIVSIYFKIRNGVRKARAAAAERKSGVTAGVA